MPDAKVGIQQSATPDRYVDNSTFIDSSGNTVYRQRVEDPELMALVRTLIDALAMFGQAFDPAGRMRVLVDPIGSVQTIPVSGTLTAVTTVTAVQGLRRLGDDATGIGFPAQMLMNDFALQQRGYGVTVT